MNDFFELFNIELSPASFTDFLIGLINTVIFSIAVSYIYRKYSNSVSNKVILSNLFPVFAVAIFLIILTIKTSIVLSLGLVGALSIIRFRTAIKEPEQIVFFLIITAISISTAANAFIFPLFIVLFVWAYYYYLSLNNKKEVHSINDQLVISSKNLDNKILDELISFLIDQNVNVEVQSINKDNLRSTVVLKISNFNIKIFDIVELFLNEKELKELEIQFFSSAK